MIIPVIGDVNGKSEKVENILTHELPNGGYILCAADISDYSLRPQDGQKIVFIRRKNTHSEEPVQNQKNGLVPLAAGEIYKLPDGTTITGFPGIFCEAIYDKGGQDQYYSDADLQKALALSRRGIDILLTDEAPVGVDGVQGREQINELIKVLRPRLLFFGKHPLHSDNLLETQIRNTRAIKMDHPHHSYVKLNTSNLQTERVTASFDQRKGYSYSWEN